MNPQLDINVRYIKNIFVEWQIAKNDLRDNTP